MNWLQKLLKKAEPPTWEYIGCVTANTTLVNDDGNIVVGLMRGDYLLEERSDGKRRYKLVGNPGPSASANYKLACVEAWVMGAALPKDINKGGSGGSGGEKKPSAKLIAFPGGKT